MSTGYYLLDHENPYAPVRGDGRRFWGYSTRYKSIQIIVVHTAEAALDTVLPDLTTENVANYFATTSTIASAHWMSDQDSLIELLPEFYTAFHVRDYNSLSVGGEIGYQAAEWGKRPTQEAAILSVAAARFKKAADKYGIPYQRITKSQVDAGVKGFISHAELDPTRRTDPGKNFPWDTFFDLMGEQEEGNDMFTPITTAIAGTTAMEVLKSHLARNRPHLFDTIVGDIVRYPGTTVANKDWDAEFIAACKDYCPKVVASGEWNDTVMHPKQWAELTYNLYVVPVGAKGAKGDAGSTGATGPAGKNGKDGKDGATATEVLEALGDLLP